MSIPINCIFGDNFRSTFLTKTIAGYLSFITMLYSLIVFSRAFWNLKKWWWWALISVLIFFTACSEQIFQSSFVCTTSITPYVQAYPYWNLWYAILLVASSAQTLVDLLWVLIYSDTYYKIKSDLEKKKAGTD